MKLSSVPESMRVEKSRELLGGMKSFTGVKESADGEAKSPANAEPAFCLMLQQSLTFPGLSFLKAQMSPPPDGSDEGWVWTTRFLVADLPCAQWPHGVVLQLVVDFNCQFLHNLET